MEPMLRWYIAHLLLSPAPFFFHQQSSRGLAQLLLLGQQQQQPEKNREWKFTDWEKPGLDWLDDSAQHILKKWDTLTSSLASLYAITTHTHTQLLLLLLFTTGTVVRFFFTIITISDRAQFVFFLVCFGLIWSPISAVARWNKISLLNC